MDKPITYKIVMTCGRISHDWMHGLTYDEAVRICEDENWCGDWNGGLVWDLEIEEEE